MIGKNDIYTDDSGKNNNRDADPSRKDIQTTKTSVITPEMLARMRAGNREEFEKLYLYYVVPVGEFLKTLMRSEALGEEMTQEVFVTLWENRGKIDPENNIAGYIYTIAKNIALKHFRRQKDRLSENLSLAESDSNNITPHEELISKEIELLIDIAIGTMPPQRREIFRLSRKTGLTNCQIAEKLNISKNTVENQITTALKYLKNVVSVK